MIDNVVPSGYTISYINADNKECFTSSDTLTDIDTSDVSYDIEGLEEGTSYVITVTLSHGDGASDEDTLVYSTQEASKTLNKVYYILYTLMSTSQLHLLHPQM